MLLGRAPGRGRQVPRGREWTPGVRIAYEARPGMTDPHFHILLVEDEPVIRELVRSMLTDSEVAVECASSGTDGLKLARSRDFHLILMDIVLPQMDGITVCRMLKSDPRTSSVPLYMLTAKNKRADVEMATRAGADGYINKPFRGSELMDLVARLRAEARK